MKIQYKGPLRGELDVPGDKSVSHRAVMFGAISSGTTSITNFLSGADCLSTISCFEKMGINIKRDGDLVTVCGRGLHGLKAPGQILDAGNSGTTTRLMSGILAGQSFVSILDGDSSLCSRPMGRIIKPLRAMGGVIESVNGNDCAPLRISPSRLKGIHYESPVSSAQVKSCILLAGLYADGITTVSEPFLSRDHTERMLRSFGADIKSEGTTCSVVPPEDLHAFDINVPGDISSAAYWIAAASITPGSEILIRSVGINPTRSGIIQAALAMGADLTVLDKKTDGPEPVADIIVRTSSLHGTVIGGELIPTLIDELPVIAVMAAFAEGTTTIKDAAELRVKESDRITLMTKNLQAMGADVQSTDDGMIIKGGRPLHEAAISTMKDHRVAMSMAIAAQGAQTYVDLDDTDCIAVSYPGFLSHLNNLIFHC